MAPVRIRVTVRDPIPAGDDEVPVARTAEAELAPPASATVNASVGAGEYRGPLEVRQGKPMRPDVALAFDRMEAAARADGVTLTITSAWRSNAEQAVLFARHPDPKWVAPPGKSLHRLGTELDLGPPAAYAWLAANATRFGFTQRYSWEPWHYGYVRNAGTSSVGFGGGDGATSVALQSFVPAQFAPAISRAAQRWSVVRRAARRAAVRRERLQPVRALARRCAGDRAVHAGDGAGLRARRPVRRRARDRRPGAPHARPAAPVRGGAARAGGLQRGRRRGRRVRLHPARTRRPAGTSRGSSACSAAPGTSGSRTQASRCGWCGEGVRPAVVPGRSVRAGVWRRCGAGSGLLDLGEGEWVRRPPHRFHRGRRLPPRFTDRAELFTNSVNKSAMPARRLRRAGSAATSTSSAFGELFSPAPRHTLRRGGAHCGSSTGLSAASPGRGGCRGRAVSREPHASRAAGRRARRAASRSRSRRRRRTRSRAR